MLSRVLPKWLSSELLLKNVIDKILTRNRLYTKSQGGGGGGGAGGLLSLASKFM